MADVVCGVCGYKFQMPDGEPANLTEGAFFCRQCDTVMLFENGSWTPVGDSELAKKIRDYIASKEQYSKELSRRFKMHWLN